jgi:hypothetical protein
MSASPPAEPAGRGLGEGLPRRPTVARHVRAGVLAVAAAAVLAASGCATPEGDPSLYREEAVSTLQAAQSSAQTVLITLDLRLRDRIFGRAADDAVSGAESSLSSTAGTFDGLQPPRGADAVRDAATQVLSSAEDAVANARIAIRRDDRPEMRRARAALGKAVDDLEHTADTLS